jgi:hypothetical protein
MHSGGSRLKFRSGDNAGSKLFHELYLCKGHYEDILLRITGFLYSVRGLEF